MTSMTRMVGITGIITMTDLFFRIAERALGLAPTIQPMIAPLFAPPSYAESEEMLDILATDEQESQSINTSIAAPDSRESNMYVEHSIQPDASSSASKETFETHRSDIPPDTSVERHVTTYPEIHQLFAQTRVSMSEQTVLAQPQYDMPVKNTQIAPAMDESMHDKLPVIERPGYKQAERQDTSEPLKHVQPLPAILPPVSFSRQKIPQATDAVIPMQHRMAYTDARESRDGLPGARLAQQYRTEPLQEDVQTTGTAPAIHVTIGRIEVRTNPVPALEARTQRQQVAPKAMSLDEYLKQSEKGGH